MPVSVKIEGLQALVTKFDTFEKDVQKKLQDELIDWGNNTKGRAIRNLSQPYPDGAVDRGILKNRIEVDIKPLNVSVVVASDYAAYVEFGTKKFAAAYVATLPQDWRTFAAQFKGGGGGTFADFVKRLTEWVHRKGLGTGFAGNIGVAGTYSTKTRKRTGNKQTQASQDKQAAYLIARKIVRDGMRAHPFLYPASEESRVELERNLKAIFQ